MTREEILDLDYYDKLDLIKQGEYLDIFIEDEEPFVREAVALKGYGLEKLVNDKSKFVRGAVAEQGYGLEKLINDESTYVREVAQDKLKKLKEKGERKE